MLLNEFFGQAIKLGKKQDKKNLGHETQSDDLFWYIVDHDKLHKDFFHPLAHKIKKDHASGKLDRHECVGKFMPRVEKGCMEFYQKNKMKGKPGKLFPKELRDDLAERLYDHYQEDIVKDKYNLGD
jgi:hypothetical protein